jgi:hypothetical protein
MVFMLFEAEYVFTGDRLIQGYGIFVLSVDAACFSIWIGSGSFR